MAGFYSPADDADVEAVPFDSGADDNRAATPDSKKLHSRPAAMTAANLLPESLANSMVSTMLSGAREQMSAQRDVAARLDALRPYFDVETSEVRQRLLWSLQPSKGSQLLKQYDLYVPLMLTLTLGALLLSGMKEAAAHADVRASEGATIVGTALAAAFTYWLGGSALLYVLSNATSIRVRIIQTLCLTGYNLAGVCAPLFVVLLFPSSTALFAVALLSVGGVSAATMGRSFASLTSNPQHAVAVGFTSALMSLSCTCFFRWRFF